MKECDNSKIHINSNFMLSISLLIMFDTLFLRPSLHCITYIMVLSVGWVKNLEILGNKLLCANPGTISSFCGGIEEIHGRPQWGRLLYRSKFLTYSSTTEVCSTKLLDANHCQLPRRINKTTAVSAKCKLGYPIIRYDRLSLTPSVSSFVLQVTVYLSYILCTSFVSSIPTNHIPTLLQHPSFSIFHNSDC